MDNGNMYPDAGRNAPKLVQKVIDIFRKLPSSIRAKRPLLYYILGSGTPDYKMSKKDSLYQDSPKDDMKCSNCEFLYKKNSTGKYICSQISGRVVLKGYCRLWKLASSLVEFGGYGQNPPLQLPPRFPDSSPDKRLKGKMSNNTHRNQAKKAIKIAKKDAEENESYNLTGNKKYVIYLDMDGVITDFDYQAQKVLGVDDHNKFIKKHGDKEFWNRIDTLDFWKKMPWKSDGRALWNYLKNRNVIILSSPSKNSDSIVGKRFWIERNLGRKVPYIFETNKHIYATPDKILIDDREKNVTNWVESGGISILHKSTDKTIKTLRKLGL